MPANAAIVVNNGAATPVAHTLSPIGKDDKGVNWYEQTAPVPANKLGAFRVGVSYRRAQSKDMLTGSGQMVITLNLPTLQVLGTNDAGITPPPTVAYAEVGRIELKCMERATNQERKDLRVFGSNLLVNAFIASINDDMSNIWG